MSVEEHDLDLAYSFMISLINIFTYQNNCEKMKRRDITFNLS